VTCDKNRVARRVCRDTPKCNNKRNPYNEDRALGDYLQANAIPFSNSQQLHE